MNSWFTLAKKARSNDLCDDSVLASLGVVAGIGIFMRYL
jgi:hypothetical protein